MTVKLIRTLNLSFGICLILVVNAVGALPMIPHGVQHPVGPGTVSVYSPRGEADEMLTPIQTFGVSDTGFVDTGQRVQVYLSNGYKDELLKFYPRWTFLIALCIIAIHLLLNLWNPRTSS